MTAKIIAPGHLQSTELNGFLSQLSAALTEASTHVTLQFSGPATWADLGNNIPIDIVLTSHLDLEKVLISLKVLGLKSDEVDESVDYWRVWVILENNDLIRLHVVAADSEAAMRLSRHTQRLENPDIRHRYQRAFSLPQCAYSNQEYEKFEEMFWRSLDAPGPTWSEVAKPILKILREPEWEALLRDRVSPGAPIDIKDGYIHFSTPEQVEETVAKHFSGEVGLWLLTVDAEALGPALKWEPSRGGALFPHLYGPLQLKDVCLARPWALT